MEGNLTIELAQTSSDSKVKVDGVEVKGVNQVEVVQKAGGLTQAILYVTPAHVTVNTSIWSVDSETAQKMVEEISKKTGIVVPAVLGKMLDAITEFGGTNGSN